VLVDEHKASVPVQQREDELCGLATTHRVILAAGVTHVKVSTDVLVVVQN